jgi:hypothetical protein
MGIGQLFLAIQSASSLSTSSPKRGMYLAVYRNLSFKASKSYLNFLNVSLASLVPLRIPRISFFKCLFSFKV